MLSLLEELMLLALDDKSGRLLPMPEYSFEFATGGAVLMDLALRDRIDCDPEQLMVVDASPTGDPVLDPVLHHLSQVREVRSTRDWLRELSEMKEIRQRALDRLVERGVLRCQDQRFFWVLGKRRYPSVDSTEEREVKRRILDVVYSDEIPDPRDAVLICVVHACGLFPSILEMREVNAAWDRIERVAGLDLMASQILSSLRRLESAVYRGRS
jgi:hypothetical protein